MLAFPENRMVMLLLLPVLIPLYAAQPADVPEHRPLAVSSRKTPSMPRHISRADILQAIQSGLAQRGFAEGEKLQPGDLDIQATPPVLTEDVGLQLMRMGFDPIRRETVFELRASLAPQYLPFEVRIHDDHARFSTRFRPGARNGATDGAGTNRLTLNPSANQDPSIHRVLAKPGRSATLLMLGQNVRITTTVVPLQPGSRGQSILVRDPSTQRVMRAEVVDDGLLETTF